MKNLPQRYVFILIYQNKNQNIFAYFAVFARFLPASGGKILCLGRKMIFARSARADKLL
jgi:hypothetical protein